MAIVFFKRSRAGRIRAATAEGESDAIFVNCSYHPPSLKLHDLCSAATRIRQSLGCREHGELRPVAAYSYAIFAWRENRRTEGSPGRADRVENFTCGVLNHLHDDVALSSKAQFRQPRDRAPAV